MSSLYLVGLFGCLIGISYGFPVDSSMKSFSSAIKNGYVEANKELTVFEETEGPACITEQWYTGAIFTENTIVRIYIDGDTTATIEYKLLLAHGVGFTMAAENANAPWATKRIGHTARNGGLFNTYRIPFQKSIRITIETVGTGTFWYIVRGVTNYQVKFGDMELPRNAKLRLYKNENVVLNPYEFITLANVTSSAGAVFMVTIEAASSDQNYLEACVRVKVDDENGFQFLSSGTEDFFLSAYYFNAGLYHDDDAGCTFHDGKGKFSAYKFFEEDPILFTKSLELVWRCGEEQSDSNACPKSFPPNNNDNFQDVAIQKPMLANTTVTTYTWVYEYSFT